MDRLESELRAPNRQYPLILCVQELLASCSQNLVQFLVNYSAVFNPFVLQLLAPHASLEFLCGVQISIKIQVSSMFFSVVVDNLL